MSRRLQIVVTCDLCENEHPEEECWVFRFSARSTAYELDTCTSCDPEEYSIASLIEVARKQRDPGLCCPDCDFCAKTARGLELHKTRKHS